MDEIKVGDIVDVYFDRAKNEIGVKVMYIPASTGDSWIVERPSGNIVYICLFAKMLKREDA